MGLCSTPSVQSGGAWFLSYVTSVKMGVDTRSIEGVLEN